LTTPKEKGMGYTVAVFKPYPFTVGQKIRIKESKRAGDWEVAAVGDRTVTLRCPISHKEFEWNLFCYQVDELQDSEWPEKE